MAKMSPSGVRALLAAAHSDALGATQSTRLSNDRAKANDYYLGDMSKDLPVGPGKSAAVSMDVSDIVEGMMPQLMDIFTGSNEIVRFEPIGPEDAQAAQQETDYINHVFMNQNDGFMVLYSMLKDALLSKVGIVKVFWEEREEEQRETYVDKTDDEYALLAADPEIEIVEHTVHAPEGEGALGGYAGQALPAPAQIPGGPGLPGGGGQLLQPQLHDLTVVTRKDYSCAKVMAVPPEEFGIERNARSIRESNYCFHKVPTTVGKLIAQGYDPKVVNKLPTIGNDQNAEQTSRDTVDEATQGGSSELNTVARPVYAVEHYIRMDYEGNGKSALYRVTTGEDEGIILKRDGKEEILQWDAMPFAGFTPVPQTHRFIGRSIADLVMDIQRIKTALLRSILDNRYLANNPRVVVAETGSNDNTVDDLLVSRMGGIVRAKTTDAVEWQVVPDISASTYPALEYLDAVAEARTGFNKRGQALDATALANQSATSANIAYSVSQQQTKMIAKIAAETGVKDTMWLLHAVVRKHGAKAKVVRLRNQWVTVDPRQWKTRDDLTIHVGLGTGDKAQQMAMLMNVLNAQKELVMGGKTNLVTDQNIFNSLKDLTRLMGKPDTETYFSDPAKQPPPQPQMDPKLIELQMKNEIEKTQAQADIATQQLKVQSEAQLKEREFELERELKIIDAQLKMREHDQKMRLAEHKAQIDEHVQTRKIEHDGMRVAHQIAAKQADTERADAEAAKPDPMSEITARLEAQQHRHEQQMAELMKHITAPKRLVRHPKTGKVEGVETVLN